jgi:sugar phosphate isomerase/epimerase
MPQPLENKTGVYRPDCLKYMRIPNLPLHIHRLMTLTLVLVMSLITAVSGAEPGTTPEEQLGWQMAIHERTFQNFTIFESMDKTAALGLKSMSFSGAIKLEGTNTVSILKLTDEQIQKIKDYAKTRGITFVNAYVPLPANEAACRKSFEFARKMGFDILVGEPEPQALDTVEKLCKEYNIRVAIHDHPKPSHYWNPEAVLEAIKGRGPLLGACADTGHWVRSGLDPVECLKKLEGHIFTLHFKDLNEKNKKAHDVPWGTGVGNTKGMMEELKRQGFHGAFCAEYEYHYENSSPELAECAKFFKETCRELAAGPPKP